jgi:putative peptidoglycan lipid II flippase
MSINTEIFTNAILVTLIGSVTQLLGFILTMLIGWRFGVTITADAYYFAMAFPIFFLNIASGIVKILFIPLFVETRIKNPQNTKSMIKNITFIFTIGSFAGMLLIAAVSPYIIHSSSLQNINPAVRGLILISLPIIPLGALHVLFSGIYNSFQRFAIPECALAIKSILVIAMLLLLSERMGIYSVAIGQVIGSLIVLLVISIVVSLHLKISLWPSWSSMPGVNRMLWLSILPVTSYILFQLNPMVARFILAQLPAGSVSIFSYAERLAAIPSLIIGTGFTTVILSHWSILSAEGNRKGLQQSLNRVITLLVMLVLPLVTGLVILREPIVAIAYQRGAFDQTAVVATASVFGLMVIQQLPMYLHMATVRILLVENAVQTLFWLNLLSAGLSLILMAILGVWCGLGVSGLALGTVLSTTAVMCVTAFIVHRRFTAFFMSTIAESTSKVLFATVFMGLAAIVVERLMMSILSGSELLRMVVTAICGCFVYLLSLRIVRHPELEPLSKFFRSRAQLLMWSRSTS